MRAILKACMGSFSLVLVALAHAGEQAATLNLLEIEPRTVAVGGPAVVLTVTPQTAVPLMVTNRVRVTYGGDLIGFARIEQVGQKSSGDWFMLMFETPEQAAAAGKLLRWLSDSVPTPLDREAQAEGDRIVQPDAAPEPPSAAAIRE